MTLIREPTISYETIDELANDMSIRLVTMKETPTFDHIKERANYGQEAFKRILHRIELLSFEEILDISNLEKFAEGEFAALLPSLRIEDVTGLEFTKKMSVNQLKFDKIDDIRLISKGYNHSDELVRMYVYVKSALHYNNILLILF